MKTWRAILIFTAFSPAVVSLCRVASAQPGAVLIRVDRGEVRVEPVDESLVELPAGQTGMIVWAEQDQERWHLFETRWQRPRLAENDSVQFDLSSASRGSRQHSVATADLGQLTTLLAQVRSTEIFRGAGGLLAPYPNAVLLDPQITIRRESGENKDELPVVEAVILRGKNEILRIPFAQGESIVHWGKIPGLPEFLKAGLPAGNYQLQLPTPTGIEVARFSVLGIEFRDELLHNEERLRRIITDESQALAVQIVVEKFLEQDPPFLCDALDWLERVSEPQRTSRLTKLQQHVGDRMRSPEVELTERQEPGAPTGDPFIDQIRSLIASGQWERALEELEQISLDDTTEGQRRRALAILYRGVILSESGPAHEAAAMTAFENAIELLHELPDGRQDQFRAHNNYANFLLGRAQDRLQNHAFQIAAGMRLPLLTSFENWLEARKHFEQALKLAASPVDAATVKMNLARQYVFLVDLLQTLAHPDDPSQRFHAAEQAAAARAMQLTQEVIHSGEPTGEETLLPAVAEELLAQMSFRNGNAETSLAHARKAYERHLENGSLVGVESASRLIGLCLRKFGDVENAQQALNAFLVSEQLSKILRERFPADELGLSRAGFFSRRTYVTEHIAELLIAQHRDAEALEHIEQSKARSLRDAFISQEIPTQDGNTEALAEGGLLTDWPAEIAALEYFLGSERAWVFVTDSDGTKAHLLKTSDGAEISSRLLISRIREFLSRDNPTGMDFYKDKLRTRLRRRQGFDQGWQNELAELRSILVPDEVLNRVRQSRNTIIVPCHVLHYFPFAALVTEEDRRELGKNEIPAPKFLIDEQFDISYSPSLTLWRRQYKLSPPNVTTASAAGIVDCPGSPPSLPGVAADLNGVRTHFANSLQHVYSEESATKPAIFSLLRQPGLVLLATHGINNPDRPLDSHLVFYPTEQGDAKNRLTADELYRTPIKADLVVLSACYSGLADRSPLPGDDVFGIQRAFLSSGTSTVLSGLWDVDDHTGPELIATFHERISQGEPAAHALAESQRAFLKKYRSTGEVEPFLHPYFWAVYTIAGDHRTTMSAPLP